MLASKLFTHQSGLTTSFKHLKHESTKGLIVYIHGYLGNKDGLKSNHVLTFCKNSKLDFLAFDLLGHGGSGGKVDDILVSDWERQSYEVLSN